MGRAARYLRGRNGRVQRATELLRDPQRAETRRMWEAVVSSDLAPKERAAAQAMAPAVTAYLSGQIDADEYARRLGAASVPQP
jgi:hypothetical protein